MIQTKRRTAGQRRRHARLLCIFTVRCKFTNFNHNRGKCVVHTSTPDIFGCAHLHTRLFAHAHRRSRWKVSYSAGWKEGTCPKSSQTKVKRIFVVKLRRRRLLEIGSKHQIRTVNAHSKAQSCNKIALCKTKETDGKKILLMLTCKCYLC